APESWPQAGDARTNTQPIELPVVILLEFIAERRPRPDQAHVSKQHVNELGQLVDRGAAQQSPQARDTLIVDEFVHRAFAAVDVRSFELVVAKQFANQLPMESIGRVRPHRAKLPDFKAAPALSDSLLPKEHRTRGV